ncbi:helix-turn-helix domain-containing protein [Actinotalea sp. BY-33]|uniref:Helix-turn-helix domain-containing protein n=1 Tax=Actinotalea soli TaxID=2819234 RepID=A0A939LSE9_9CELL|nr:helix-turn-helix domain-containing protein [Actinotalea soli]MBO1750497.1 helix-turn-helix domain-containing protein [Actinotalea soli]
MTRDPYPSFDRRTSRTAGRAAEPPRILLSVEETGYLLGIGRTRVYELMKSGALESVHVGRLRKIPAEALRDFVERCRSYVSTSV